MNGFYFRVLLEVFQKITIMRNQDDGIANFICLDENICHLKSTFRIKVSCWLISNDKIWRMNNRSRHSNFLLFSSTKFFDFPGFNAREVKERIYRFIFFLDLGQRSTFQNQRINHIFFGTEAMNELIILENDSDFSPISLDFRIRKIRHIFHLVINRLFIRFDLPNQKFYERRFPRSRLPGNNGKISLLKLKIKLFEEYLLAI